MKTKTVAEIEKGTIVCVKGQGTDSFVHSHVAVARVTKTMIVTKDGRRFRRESTGRSVPYSAYGGTRVSPYCQRPKTS